MSETQLTARRQPPDCSGWLASLNAANTQPRKSERDEAREDLDIPAESSRQECSLPGTDWGVEGIEQEQPVGLLCISSSARTAILACIPSRCTIGDTGLRGQTR